MKTARRKVSLVLCIVSLLALLGGCAPSEKGNALETIPNYGKYSALIGLTKSEILQKQNWKEEDVVEDALTLYSTPEKIEYAGYTFDVKLGIDYDLGKLDTIHYQTAFEADPETAAAAAVAVGQQIANDFKTPNNSENHIASIKKEDFVKAFTGKKGYKVINWWDMTEQLPASQKAYMEEFKAAREKQSLENVAPTVYGLEMKVSYIEETNKAYIVLRYGIFPTPAVK